MHAAAVIADVSGIRVELVRDDDVVRGLRTGVADRERVDEVLALADRVRRVGLDDGHVDVRRREDGAGGGRVERFVRTDRRRVGNVARVLDEVTVVRAARDLSAHVDGHGSAGEHRRDGCPGRGIRGGAAGGVGGTGDVAVVVRIGAIGIARLEQIEVGVLGVAEQDVGQRIAADVRERDRVADDVAGLEELSARRSAVHVGRALQQDGVVVLGRQLLEALVLRLVVAPRIVLRRDLTGVAARALQAESVGVQRIDECGRIDDAESDSRVLQLAELAGSVNEPDSVGARIRKRVGGVQRRSESRRDRVVADEALDGRRRDRPAAAEAGARVGDTLPGAHALEVGGERARSDLGRATLRTAGRRAVARRIVVVRVAGLRAGDHGARARPRGSRIRRDQRGIARPTVVRQRVVDAESLQLVVVPLIEHFRRLRLRPGRRQLRKDLRELVLRAGVRAVEDADVLVHLAYGTVVQPGGAGVRLPVLAAALAAAEVRDVGRLGVLLRKQAATGRLDEARPDDFDAGRDVHRGPRSHAGIAARVARRRLEDVGELVAVIETVGDGRQRRGIDEDAVGERADVVGLCGRRSGYEQRCRQGSRPSQRCCVSSSGSRAGVARRGAANCSANRLPSRSESEHGNPLTMRVRRLSTHHPFYRSMLPAYVRALLLATAPAFPQAPAARKCHTT